MTRALQYEMILLAALLTFVIIRGIRRNRLQIRDSLIWFAVAVALLLLGLAPGILSALCRLLGISIPSNLLFLLGIVFLMLLCFEQTCALSRQTDEIRKLMQQVSILKYEQETAAEAPPEPRHEPNHTNQ